MPGNGFPLAIHIRREVHCVGILSQLFEFCDHLLFTGKGCIFGFPVIVWIYTHTINELGLGFFGPVDNLIFRRQLASDRRLSGTLFRICSRAISAGWQIANMANTGFDNKVIAQIPVDGFGFGW